MSTTPEVPLRSPDQVMRLARMGSAHPTRLSFKRSLLRMLHRDGWTFDRPVWRLDGDGFGSAVYRANGPERSYSLVAFSHDLPADRRSDRVIATAWDATFTLFDGTPTEADLARLRDNVPLQEAGRLRESELTLSRANRSVRIFDHVVESLAAGHQPDRELIDSVGYLMRTTAVYGSGKFGAADRRAIVDRLECRPSFRIEMLTVWLIRAFTIDLVEHLAVSRSPETATRLANDVRCQLGVGNSTGLGMAPFLVNHPRLLDLWVTARETALARVRSIEHTDDAHRAAFHDTLGRARRGVASWNTPDEIQQVAISELMRDLETLTTHIRESELDGRRPWDRLWQWGEQHLGLEGQELLLSLMLEPHGDLVDHLADELFVTENRAEPIDSSATVGDLVSLIDDRFAWALTPDYATNPDSARFWYTSQEKLEPRLGERHEEPGAELEMPLAIGRDVAAAHRDALLTDPALTVAVFVDTYPEHRHIVRRVQMTGDCAYGEIRDNLICETMRPIDLLRFKLAYFGAAKFDPKSDRWTRITMFQHAPHPDDFTDGHPDDWAHAPPSGGCAERGPGWGPPIELEQAERGIDGTIGTDAVDCAPSQLETLAKQAVRGVGHRWGVAEDVARSVTWLEQHGLPGAACLAQALDADGQAGDRSASCLLIAPRLSDELATSHGPSAGEWTIPSPAPLLLLRHLAAFVDRTDLAAVTATWPTPTAEIIRIVMLPGRPPMIRGHVSMTASSWCEPETIVTVRATATSPDTDRYTSLGAAATRTAIDGSIWEALCSHEFESYVPATDASRLAGAGAGLLDND